MNAGLPVVLQEVWQEYTRTYVYGLGLVSQMDEAGSHRCFLADGLGFWLSALRVPSRYTIMLLGALPDPTLEGLAVELS